MGFHTKIHNSTEHPTWPLSACAAEYSFVHTFTYGGDSVSKAHFDLTAKSPRVDFLAQKHSSLSEYEDICV